MKWKNAKGIIHKVIVREKEYEVLVENSATPSTNILFRYAGCVLIQPVHIKDDIEPEELQYLLERSVKQAIYDYNAKRTLSKLRKAKASGEN